MRTDQTARRAELSAWTAENLRLTAFTDEDLNRFDPSWLSEFCGNSAINVQEERAIGARNQTVPFESGTLAVATSPGILNLIFAPTAQPDPTFSTHVPLTESSDVFKSVSRRWLEQSPAIQRLAFGAVLRLPIEDRESGYRLISNYLNFDLDPTNSFDFSFQINHPRTYKPDSLNIKINRLARWSVAGAFVFMMHPQTQAQSKRKVKSYCRLELDINTNPEHVRALPNAELLNLFETLIDFGTEIVKEGDLE